MKLSDFDYPLPSKQIAQTPVEARDQSRLMVVDRRSGRIEHRVFRELPDILEPDHLLVLNDSRVFKARLFGRRENQAPVEVLLVRDCGDRVWEVLIKPGRRVKASRRIVFQPGGFEAVALETSKDSPRRLRFEFSGEFWDWVEKLGNVPLPPYIRREANSVQDVRRYQTVYAKARGSIAAPTAGLHFTKEMLERIRHHFVTLHVGYGTFRPISAENVEQHRMDAEHYHLEREAAEAIAAQLKAGRTVTAVGTTSTRALETVAWRHGAIRESQGWTELFIYPGFKFQAVGALLTNFHLPRSTLLLLVSAFAGTELIRECYRTAVEKRYRFYSYGDAMLIR